MPLQVKQAAYGEVQSDSNSESDSSSVFKSSSSDKPSSSSTGCSSSEPSSSSKGLIGSKTVPQVVTRSGRVSKPTIRVGVKN